MKNEEGFWIKALTVAQSPLRTYLRFILQQGTRDNRITSHIELCIHRSWEVLVVPPV